MSPFEQEVLVNIVDSFKSVVENKKNDIHSIGKKEKTWSEIEKQFCAIAGVIKRDRDQLKKTWQNLKARAKRSISQEKRERLKTGGGCPPEKADATTERVASMLPTQMHPLENPYDDDTEMHDKSHQQASNIRQEAGRYSIAIYLQCISMRRIAEKWDL